MSIHSLFPYLRVRRCDEAIAFYAAAFGAVELFRLVEPSGRVGHAELRLGTATLMLSDAFPELGINAPDPEAPSGFLLHLHVDDADGVIAAAVEAGARVIRPAADHFYGERSGMVRDPFGHDWSIGHSIETLTPEEMQRRYTLLSDQE